MNKSKYYIFILDFADTYFIDKWSLENDKHKFQYLKYSNFLWKIVNNKFIYQSRLRINDYEDLFIKYGFEVKEVKRCDVLCNQRNIDYFNKLNFEKKNFNDLFINYSKIDLFTTLHFPQSCKNLQALSFISTPVSSHSGNKIFNAFKFLICQK